MRSFKTFFEEITKWGSWEDNKWRSKHVLEKTVIKVMGSGQHIIILQNCSVYRSCVRNFKSFCWEINQWDLVEDNKSSTKHDYRKSRMSLFLRPISPPTLAFKQNKNEIYPVAFSQEPCLRKIFFFCVLIRQCRLLTEFTDCVLASYQLAFFIIQDCRQNISVAILFLEKAIWCEVHSLTVSWEKLYGLF